MQKSDVECQCGAIYNRVEVTEMHEQPRVHQFVCGVCGHTLEAGITRSLIGYRMVVQPEGPFMESPLNQAKSQH
jgi:hypothetical protein